MNREGILGGVIGPNGLGSEILGAGTIGLVTEDGGTGTGTGTEGGTEYIFCWWIEICPSFHWGHWVLLVILDM